MDLRSTRGKFREFWEKSAREFEDMGEFIRESIDEWLRRRKEAEPHGKRAGGKQQDRRSVIRSCRDYSAAGIFAGTVSRELDRFWSHARHCFFDLCGRQRGVWPERTPNRCLRDTGGARRTSVIPSRINQRLKLIDIVSSG